MNPRKITVIGSGSVFFTRQLIKGMVSSPILKGFEVALVDVNQYKCEQMGKFCQLVNQAEGSPLTITYTCNRREALPGSDFVVLTFVRANILSRGIGAHVCQNYGVLEASGDTAGPGAIFRVMRAVPEVLEVAADIEALAPQATVMNCVNPTNIVGAALDRRTRLKWFSFCDGMYNIEKGICSTLGLDVTPENLARIACKIGGINHFGWLFDLRLDGRDVFDDFAKGVRRYAELKGTGAPPYAQWQLTEVFRAWPTVIWHAQEYLRYFQGRGSRPARDFVVKPWRLHERMKWVRRVWREIADCNTGKLAPSQIMGDMTSDMLAKVVESIVGDLKARFPVNVRNEGRISNLPSDTIVELFGAFGKDGAEVPAIGGLPRGVLGLTQQVIDEQELALEAALSGNFDTLVRAIACDPLVMSLSDAKDIARDIMAVEEEHREAPYNPTWDACWADEGA